MLVIVHLLHEKMAAKKSHKNNLKARQPNWLLTYGQVVRQQTAKKTQWCALKWYEYFENIKATHFCRDFDAQIQLYNQMFFKEFLCFLGNKYNCIFSTTVLTCSYCSCVCIANTHSAPLTPNIVLWRETIVMSIELEPYLEYKIFNCHKYMYYIHTYGFQMNIYYTNILLYLYVWQVKSAGIWWLNFGWVKEVNRSSFSCSFFDYIFNLYFGILEDKLVNIFVRAINHQNSWINR